MAHRTSAPPRAAAIYCRVSSRAQAESNDSGRGRPAAEVESDKDEKEQETSLDTQLTAGRAYAAEHGYVVDEQHVYREVHTGVELWERPKLSTLREAVRRREVDMVIAYAIDRVARDPVHLGVILSEAEHAGVAVEFVTEPLDASPEGQLIRFVRGYAAKVEHEKIKERTVRGRMARLASGKPLPGWRAPFGYQWATADNSELVLDPQTAPVVARIVQQALQGPSLRSIATTLTTEGVPAPTGGRIPSAKMLPADVWFPQLKMLPGEPTEDGTDDRRRAPSVSRPHGRALPRGGPDPAGAPAGRDGGELQLTPDLEAQLGQISIATVQRRLTHLAQDTPRLPRKRPGSATRVARAIPMSRIAEPHCLGPGGAGPLRGRSGASQWADDQRRLCTHATAHRRGDRLERAGGGAGAQLSGDGRWV
jgi:DNA invertase Pin-like site-specific DNA recombinase